MPEFPKKVSAEFLDDVITLAICIYEGTQRTEKEGLKHQEMMKRKYPAHWMEHVFEDLGWVGVQAPIHFGGTT